jgi:hypothetical protein
MAAAQRFRFRPRFVGLAVTASALGLGLLAVAAADLLGAARALGLVLGAGGATLGPLYAASPAWRLVVVVDDDALSVERGGRARLRLPWPEVVRVVWSPATSTMYVDGGAPERSLLVPGPGATAPYDLEDRPALCRAVLAHVAADRVIEVPSLEQFAKKGPA